MNKIPYGKQAIDEKDVKAVIDVLKSDYLTTGPKIKEFEEKFKRYVGSKFAVAVSSGTAGLHIACLAAGLKQGNEIITSPITFAASANCSLYCQARPVFVDIIDQGLIDAEKIEEKINEKTKIIVPVHIYGLSCDMEKIKEIAEKYNLKIIEDACQALGGKYKNKKIGSCEYSNMCVFSFHPVKHITTGEGGIITTNSKELYEKLVMLRSHGITKDKEKMENKEEGRWYYEMQDLGYNYRITDIQSALGISQLDKAGEFLEKRRKIAEKYDKELGKLKEIELIKENENQESSYHLYVIKLKDKETRRKLYDYLEKNNILCQVHHIPVYFHPYYKKLGYEKGICPEAEKFYEKILSIPIYPELSEEEQDYIIEKIKGFLNNL